MKYYFIAVVEVKNQGQILTIFCLWSYLFLAWKCQSPGATLIQPRHKRTMIRGLTPGITPRYHSLSRQKMVQYDTKDPLISLHFDVHSFLVCTISACIQNFWSWKDETGFLKLNWIRRLRKTDTSNMCFKNSLRSDTRCTCFKHSRVKY